jgi:hypothetical protein
MAAWHRAGAHQTHTSAVVCRGGLSSRPGLSDQLQISVDAGNQFDLDAEIDGLRGQLGRLKQVRTGSTQAGALRVFCVCWPCVLA